jgi:cytoskeletal protein RodZ
MAVKSRNAKAAELTQLNLRGRRMKQGLSLEQIAETTKISIRFLHAIEAENFKELPGGIFNTSYLKQYAAAVNFDEAKLLSFYEREMSPAPSVNVVPDRSATRGILRWITAAGR